MTQNKEYSAMAFGEVMLRLSPVWNERIAIGNQFIKHAGGSELNVLSGIARLGLRTGLLSKLPANPVGRFIRNQIRSYGVSDDYISQDDGPNARLGIYYYESGAYPRKPHVTYDRAGSSFANMHKEEIPPEVFGKSRLFHTSGVTMALSPAAREASVSLIKNYKKAGAQISFDVNYRATLWSEEDARATITPLLPYIDILFISEETCRRMMQKTGSLESIQAAFAKEYGISVIASTMRTINSPRSHDFTSTIYSAAEDTHFTAEPFKNIEVVDRIGSGDAYVAGVLYALLAGKPASEASLYGNAMSAVKNTIPGDLTTTDLPEIESIIRSQQTGGGGEMNR